MQYTEDIPVPPLPIERKREISKLLVLVFNDPYIKDKMAYLSSIKRQFTKEEWLYAEFWWKREVANPEWRKKDPHQGKPARAHLSLVR